MRENGSIGKLPDGNHSLRYGFPSPMKIPHLFVAFLLCLASTLRAQIVISEFLASNSNSIVDENGDNEDWIEITNASGGAVNLLGWYLTDDINQPRKWAFPSMTLNSGAYRVVFASNKNRTNPAANLHTNFKLNASPAYLALTQDIGGGGVQVAQAFNLYPKQVTDISYGLSYTTTALVTAGSAAKALVPTVGNGGSALGTSWRGASEPFADGGWQSGTPGVGMAGTATAVAAANLKLRLEAPSLAGIGTDSSGAAHNGVNVGATTTWLASATDTAPARLLRRGVMQFASSLSTSSQMVVPAHADFNGTTGTIMFWMKSAGTAGTAGGGSDLVHRSFGVGEEHHSESRVRGAEAKGQRGRAFGRGHHSRHLSSDRLYQAGARCARTTRGLSRKPARAARGVRRDVPDLAVRGITPVCPRALR